MGRCVLSAIGRTWVLKTVDADRSWNGHALVTSRCRTCSMTRIALLVLLCASVLWSMPAKASSDVGCSPSWKLSFAGYSGCDDTAMVGPRNDSRTNLMLLMADLPGSRAHGGPPSLLSSSTPRRSHRLPKGRIAFSQTAKGRAAEATRPAPPISKPPCVAMPRCPNWNAPR